MLAEQCQKNIESIALTASAFAILKGYRKKWNALVLCPIHNSNKSGENISSNVKFFRADSASLLFLPQ